MRRDGANISRDCCSAKSTHTTLRTNKMNTRIILTTKRLQSKSSFPILVILSHPVALKHSRNLIYYNYTSSG